MVKDYNLGDRIDNSINNYKYTTITEWAVFLLITCLSIIILYNLDGVHGFVKGLLVTIFAIIISYKSTGKIHHLLSGVYNKISIKGPRQ